MKRSFLILLIGIIGIVVIFLLKPKRPIANESPVMPTPIVTSLNAAVEQTNNSTASTVTQAISTAVASARPQNLIDAIQIQDIAEWTSAIPNLTLSHHFRNDSSWVMAEIDATNPPKITLTGANGDTIQYAADFIGIEVTIDQIQRIDLHSPKMNIDDIRQLGNQLLKMMGKDTAGFNTWCDKVGNRWMDQPEYSSGNAKAPNSDKTYAFSAHPTFNNDKPWYIYFVIAGK